MSPSDLGLYCHGEVFSCHHVCFTSLECKVLKNRKSMGSLQEQFVRQAPKPTIVEVDGSQSDARKKQPLISEVDEGVR